MFHNAHIIFLVIVYANMQYMSCSCNTSVMCSVTKPFTIDTTCTVMFSLPVHNCQQYYVSCVHLSVTLEVRSAVMGRVTSQYLYPTTPVY